MLNDHEGAVAQAQPATRKPAQRRKPSVTTPPNEAERRFADTLIDGYYETDLDARLTWANTSLCRLLRRPQNEVIGMRLVRLDAGDAPARAFARVLETGAPEPNVEGALALPDGSVLLAELSITLRRDEAGQPTGFSGIVRDIGERQGFTHELQRQVDILSTLQQVDVELSYKLDVDLVLNIAMRGASILSNAAAGYIALCDDGRLSKIRTFGGIAPDAVHLDGAPRDGILKRVIDTSLPALVPDVTRDPEYVAIVPETRAKIVMPISAHGRLLAVLNLETPDAAQFSIDEFDFLKMLAKHIATAIDNAVLHEVLQKQLSELTALYQEKTELEKLKTDMIRTVTHDVRSPLTIITGYISVLGDELRNKLDDMQLAYFDAINRATNRIQRLTTEMLTLEKVQNGAQLLREPVLLDVLVRKAVFDHRESAGRKQQTLVSNVRDDLRVLGDEHILMEAVANLIHNAIKYTPDGGTITVDFRREGERAVLEVQDTGIGIPDDAQSDLFKPFKRIRTQETKGIDGTGLGLYLVKTAIERHGGTMRFRSTYGKGSMFGFDLPIDNSVIIES